MAQLDWMKHDQQGHDVLLPGEPEARARQQRLENGIYVDEVSWKQFEALGL